MKLGTPVTTPIGNGTINGTSTRTGTLLYRVTGVDGAIGGGEAWFQAEYLERA